MATTAHLHESRPGPGRSALALSGYVLAVVAVAVVGSLAAISSSEIYADLDKPAFAPPAGVFGPVWTALYVLIALSGWLVWRQVGVDRSLAPYAAQLVLNALWTPIFFAAGWYAVALVEILLLLAALLVTMVMFWQRSRPATLLLVPYLAWVGFATALTFAIWRAN